METERLRQEFQSLILEGDSTKAIERANEILEGGMTPFDFFQGIFTPAMTTIGEMFGRLDIFLPELLSAAETAKIIIEKAVHPRIEGHKSGSSINYGKVLIGAVKGDLHDIGKNMVALMLEVNGFEVLDAGVNVEPRVFIERALSEKVDIVGLSSLMVTSMPYMKEVIDFRDGFGHKDKFAIIVGGAPITLKYSQEIGADAYGENAAEAVSKCIELLKNRSLKAERN